MDTQRFRGLIDRFFERGTGLPERDRNLKALYEYYGITPGTRLSVDELAKHVKGLIEKEALKNVRGVRERLNKIGRHLIAEYILEEKPLQPYYGILSWLGDTTRSLRPEEDEAETDYEHLVKCGFELHTLEPEIFGWSDTDIIRFERRDVNCFAAAKRLKVDYPGVEVTEGDVQLSDEVAQQVFNSVEGRIRYFGGREFLACLFKGLRLETKYDDTLERFILIRDLNFDGSQASQIPWGFLINLAVKNINSPSNITSGYSEHLGGIIELTKDFFAAIDVQPYSIWEYAFLSGEKLRDGLREIALYDTCFALPQLRWRDAEFVTLNLFVWLSEEEQRKNLGISVKGLLTIYNFIIEKYNESDKRPFLFNLDSLLEELREAQSLALSAQERSTVESLLVHGEEGANSRFGSLNDLREVNLGFRPLVRYRKPSVFLMHPSVNSLALYESVFERICNAGIPAFDQRMGTAFEDAVLNLFSDHGIQAISGTYVDGSGEVDILVESDKSIHLIEAKKKSLTRKARAGEDVYLFIDVFLSFIASQIQLFRHELRFRKEGFLDLNLKSGGTHRVEFLGREINKISLSLHDYEGLQYRLFTTQCLPRIIERNWVLGTPENDGDRSPSDYLDLVRRFGKINILSEKLRGFVKEIIETGVKVPFFNSWFLSFGHVSMFLDGVKDSEGFSENMKKMKHLIASTWNTYADHLAMRRIAG